MQSMRGRRLVTSMRPVSRMRDIGARLLQAEESATFGGRSAHLPLSSSSRSLWLWTWFSGGLEGHAFFGMELDVESVPDGRAQRRMGSREQDAAAELDLEVDEFAEEYFLVDARLPDVVS